MRNVRDRLLLIAGLALVCPTPSFAQAGQPAKLSFVRTVRLVGADSNTDDGHLGIVEGPEVDAAFTKPQVSGTTAPARVPAAHVPRPPASSLVSEPVFGFNGLTHLDQRLAPTGVATGINLSVTPPDQGLAVGGGVVVEAVNNAVAVYNAATKERLGVWALSFLFGVAPTLDLATGASGPFLSDPRVYYDWDTGHFFLTEVTLGEVPSTGAFDGTSGVFVAVSQTNDPTGVWNVYRLDTTSDGTAAFGTCPCFGDQPLIGADANGFYISTNAFSISARTFRGAQVYAVAKSALLGGGGTIAARRFAPVLQAPDTVAYTIQPATVPPGGAWAPNTEYFMSALDPNNSLDDRLTVWALQGTNNLATATLVNGTVATQVYGLPPAIQQRSGQTPLLDLLANGPSIFDDGSLYKNHLELIESNDDRMQQVVYAAGQLWTGLTTVVKPPNGPVRTGAAWFAVTPRLTAAGVTGVVAKQGYLSVNQNSVAFPSIAVNAQGKGAIGVSVIGQGLFPSAAYARVDAVNGAGPLVLAGVGAAPLDDFSGYAPFGFRVARWGDYSAATVDENGDVWVANEFVPNAPRTVLTNWGTFVSKVTP
jgi:hypothetical protein